MLPSIDSAEHEVLASTESSKHKERENPNLTKGIEIEM